MRNTFYVCLYWPSSPTKGMVFDRLCDARAWARYWARYGWDSYRIVKVRAERVCDKDTGGER